MTISQAPVGQSSATVRNPRRRRAVVDRPTDLLTPYARVSTQEQADSGAGLDYQQTVIPAWAVAHGARLGEWRIDAGASGKDLNRPAMSAALDDVRTGRTGGIIVAKLDRLSRSVIDFAGLMAEAVRDGWNIVLVDLGVDLRSPNGKLVAGIIAQIAEWEREMIAARTREGLAAKRAAGVRLGRPREATDELLERVVALWRENGSYAGTARTLNEAGVATVQGGRMWYPASVRSMVMSQDGAALTAA